MIWVPNMENLRLLNTPEKLVDVPCTYKTEIDENHAEILHVP